MKYYCGVCIRKSGHCAVTKPYADLDECLKEVAGYVVKHHDQILSTTYIVREGPDDGSFSLQDVFGKPMSRDFMRNRSLLAKYANGD